MHSYAILRAKKRPTKEVDDVSVGVVALGDLSTCIAPAAVPERQVLGNLWNIGAAKHVTYLVTT